MTNQDTANLLRETDKGIKMAMYSFDQLLERVKDPALKKVIKEAKNEHQQLQNDTEAMMKAHNIYEEDPGPMAKGMAWLHTNTKMSMEDDDRTIADIITDGCNMGSKKLYKYINEYAKADENAAQTAKQLITAEENLEEKLRLYL